VTIRRLLAAACLIAALSGLALGPSNAARADGAKGPVMVIHFNRAVDEVAVGYVRGALKRAEKQNAEVVVIELDTPGGLISSMRKIVSDIFASPVPVVVWVGPAGARAASAGTFIAVASSYLAMAPATNIGAAAAVGSQGENLPSTEAKKVNQDDAALMRSIASQRRRPAAALEKTIFQAKSYSVEEARRLGIAELEIRTLDGLIEKLNDRVLATAAGPRQVHTAGARIEHVHLSFFERFRSFLADPNLVFLLLNLGGLGLIIELWTGGQTWVPGSLGIVCLLLAFAGLSVLPFSWAGLALILVGIVFLGFELHAPGGAFFGATGTVSIILGGVFLLGYFDSPGLPGYNPTVSLWLLISLAVIVGFLVLLMAREVHLSHHGKRYVSPLEQKALVGAVAEVSTRLEPKGEVLVGGEAWQAKLEGAEAAEPGERVSVIAVDGLHLVVEPLSDEEKNQANP
jgi:membrane-bound serine protease (ClpP class)